MTIDYGALEKVPRLLMEVPLRPLQGNRFQPTGFPDLGPACYTLSDGTEMLLVESTQSMANRLEAVCWDSLNDDLIPELKGLPYIRVNRPDGSMLTSSILEAHRINSEYIVNANYNGKLFKDFFKQKISYRSDQPIQWQKLWTALLKYDLHSLIHGCFLEEIGGRLRVTRALTGFIEASGVRPAESGGVKNNIVEPELKKGAGNVPFHRTEFVAEKITAYFNLDLALLRGYGLPEDATKLLIALSLFKIRRFLSTGVRLRTACDLTTAGDLQVTQPSDGFTAPDENSLLEECQRLIHACTQQRLFADPPVTIVQWEPTAKKREGQERDTSEEPAGEDEE